MRKRINSTLWGCSKLGYVSTEGEDEVYADIYGAVLRLNGCITPPITLASCMWEFSFFLTEGFKTPQKSILDAKFAKILQKSAFSRKNICTIQK